jgi:protein-S-isoprenylcysteine O-methyltransferase Ste14
MKLSMPPAVILMVHLGLAWLCNRFLGFANFQFSFQKLVSLSLFFVGIIMTIWTIFVMYRARTTIDPVSPDRASKLITTGIFSISRNPIYLALLMLLMAWVIWLGNVIAIFLGATFVWQLTHFQIHAEEEALEAKFGKRYLEYKKRVRKWI